MTFRTLRAGARALSNRKRVRRPLSVEERLAEKLAGLDTKMAAQESLEGRLAGFEKRMDGQVRMQQEQQEKELSKTQEIEKSLDRGRGLGR